MSWIDDNKGSGPWTLENQPNKFGYLNNPNWTDEATDGHTPCGHWHKGPLITSEIEYVYDDFWQQAVAPLKSHNLYAVGALGYNQDAYIIQIYDADGNVVVGHSWEPNGWLSDVVGAVQFISLNGNPTAFYMNNNTDTTTHLAEHFLHILDITGEHKIKSILVETYTDLSNYETVVQHYFMRPFVVSSSGVVVTAFSVVKVTAGVTTRHIYIKRSTDYGKTFVSSPNIDVDGNMAASAKIDVDSTGVFYLIYSDDSAPKQVLRIWKSIDEGANFTEIITLPSAIAKDADYITIDITGTKIYLSYRVYAGAAYENHICYSTDAGANWTTNPVSVSGEEYLQYFTMIANTDVVVIVAEGRTTKKIYLLRSINSGVDWTTIGQIDPELTWPDFRGGNADYGLLVNDENYIAYTNCGSEYKDTDSLAVLISVDDGETWTAQKIPLFRNDEVATSLGMKTETYIEPQVWPFTK